MTKEIPKTAWVPSGIDPTDLDYPLTGATPKGCLSKVWSFGVIALAMYGIFALYQQSLPKVDAGTAPDEIATQIPTATPTTEPTPTTLPGTATPTPRPSATAAPTATQTPPGSMATWTPGPWLITRFAATHAAILGTPEGVSP